MLLLRMRDLHAHSKCTSGMALNESIRDEVSKPSPKIMSKLIRGCAGPAHQIRGEHLAPR